MPALGVIVSSRSTLPSRGTFSQTGTAFIAGKADAGSTTVAVKMQSIADCITAYGARTTNNANFYDSVDEAFQEGCTVVWGGRVVGPAAAPDTINVPGTSGNGLVWTATNPGPSGVKLQVTNGTDGTTRILKVIDAVTSALIAATPQYSANASALGTLGPGVVTIGGGSGLTPVMAATAPTGGTSDLSNVTSTQIATGVALFLKRYGPGIVSASGMTVSGTPDVLDAHAKANSRFAFLDVPDTQTDATITTYMATLTDQSSTYSAFFGPWGQQPGVNGSPVTRNTPASAAISGLYARVVSAGNPNRAAMGTDFAPRNLLSLNKEYDDATLQSLYDTNGLNLMQTYYGVLINKGFRTMASASVDPINFQANCALLRMFIFAATPPIGLPYFGRPIEAGTEASYGSDLGAFLQTLADAKAIYPQDSNNPFRADTSVNVNQPATVALGELIGVLTYTPTTAATSVQIQLAPIPVSA